MPGVRRSPTGGYAYGLACLASVAVIGFLVDLPFSLYRTFVIEAASASTR